MRYKFIGYGSLLSHKSLNTTIPDRKFTPVIVHGFRRVFNVDLDPKSKDDTDVLNVIPSKGSFFNGIMIGIGENELKKLKGRESHYIFEKVEAQDYRTKKIYTNCIMSRDHNMDIDLGKKKPKRSYIHLCREAAYDISDDFGSLWDNTTFTSDNTPITEFFRKNPGYDKTNSTYP